MIKNFEKLLTDHPDMCCEVEPKDYPPYLDYPKECKPMTKYNQLVSKSVEELAEWIVTLPSEDIVCPPVECNLDWGCKKCWLEWLKSPVNLEAGK